MLITFGTLNTLTSKYQNVNGFKHGIFQSLLVGLAQTFLMPPLLISVVKYHF